MRSIEPGISRFRVWSFGPPRNDNRPARLQLSRHSGAMRSIEPGISGFRVWSFGPPRNDNRPDCVVACVFAMTR
ncbi:MAG: hypothetical protein E6G79_16260 [Alphaproteobacteria bacterium]|nr:MAG: hypothetical protein E6G79_16260 [Alphaproteobacteria bacterium]